MSFPYKYKVKWCPVCNQGWVEILKDNVTGEPLLSCDECYSVWKHPEQVERNSSQGLALDILTVDPTEEEIEKWGWKEYILQR